MSTEQVQVEKDGFVGEVRQNAEKGTEFIVWNLGNLYVPGQKPAPITGVSGVNGSPRAAAYNLDHTARLGYLMNALRKGIQIGRGPNGVVVAVPGAAVQIKGYETPLKLTLETSVPDVRGVSQGIAYLASQVARAAARGVYSLTNPTAEAEIAEAAVETIADIQF